MSRIKMFSELLEPRVLLSVGIVADVNPAPLSGTALTRAVDLNGTAYFVDDDAVNGAELWKSDGTSAGTSLVKDINPGSATSSPTSLTVFNNQLYFSANDGVHGAMLWKSDGTAAGTRMVDSFSLGKSPHALAVLGNQLLFFANDEGDTSGEGLWLTDGTTITKLKSVYDSNAISASNSVVMNGALYFIDGGTTAGGELWRSDGTAGGTMVVKAITGSYPMSNLTVLGNRLVFTFAYNQLWASDGTTAGTSEIGAIGTSSSSTAIANLTIVGGTLFFTASTSANGTELYSTDGSTFAMVKDIYPGAVSSSPSSLSALNGKLYFAAFDTTHGTELWSSDGTAGGTMLVQDIRPGSSSSSIANMAAANGRLYFYATNGTSAGLWSSDGVTATFLKSFANLTSYKPNLFSAVGGKVFLAGDDGIHGVEPWITDGTVAGTQLLKDIYPVTDTAQPRFIGTFGNKLFYFANDNVHGVEPWVTDGTAAGTQLLKDINPSGDAIGTFGDPTGKASGNYLYFLANNGSGYTQLWRTDSTAAGTIQLTNSFGTIGLDGAIGNTFYYHDSGSLYSTDGTVGGSHFISSAGYGGTQAIMDGKLYSQGHDSTHGNELWVSDGTAAGTHIVVDATPGTGGGSIEGMQVVGSKLYYMQLGSGTTSTLFTSDGTAAGTTAVTTVSWYADGVGASGGKYYFAGGQYSSTGQELWVSDGTAAGTHIVTDINPGSGNSNPNSLVDLNGILLFDATGPDGSRLYRSDGTAAGTYELGNFTPQYNSVPSTSPWVRIGDAWYLVADGPIASIWKTDGTAAGTIMLDNVQPGTTTYSGQLAPLGTSLMFTADDGIHGQEVWRATLDDTPPTALSVATADDNGFGVTVHFDQPLAGVTKLSKLVLVNTTTHQTIASSGISGAVNGDDLRLRFSAGALADGNYTITLPAGLVSATSGDPLPTDYNGAFFILAADANHDRIVNTLDFNALATNYGKSATFSQGDFDYSGTVGSSDFDLLASRFGMYLAPPAGSGAIADAVQARPATSLAVQTSSLFGDQPVGAINDLLD